MELKELIISALQSLRSNVLRTLLTMLGIVIGIASVILIISLGKGATAAITNELSSFGTNFFGIVAGSVRDGSAFGGTLKTLTLDDARAIESDASLSNINRVSPLVVSSVIATANGESDRVSVYGIQPEFFTIFKPTLVSGRALTDEDVLGFSKIALIGYEAVETFFGKQFDAVGETIRVDGRPFRIVGVLKSDSQIGSSFNNTLFLPLPIVMKQMLGQSHVMEIHVSVQNVELINQTMEDVSVLLRVRHKILPGEDDDFSVQSFQDALSTLEMVTGLLTTLIAAISGISLLVGGIGIMNIMLVTVTERTREIGLLKAIGAKKRNIIAQFLIESVVLTVAGGIMGILIGVSTSYIITRVVGIPFIISVSSIVIAVGVSMAVGIIFGLYPARRAANLNPIEALRHE